jgi:D-glycero-alpha-D-manno-heptose-7-phosphate kinase
MITSKTPYRISFFGGGSDLESYYEKNTGYVISTSIDKYIYLSVNKKYEKSIRVNYSKTENVNNVSEIKHDIVREVLKYFELTSHLDITCVGELPSNGTGLGSSSAFTVGLISALNKYLRLKLSTYEIANLACHVEIEILGKCIGKQDQYASAFGGFNEIIFEKDGNVVVNPLNVSKDLIIHLQNNLLLLDTKNPRNAEDILVKQSDNIKKNPDVSDNLSKMIDLAKNFKDMLQNNDIDNVGYLLHESWILKKNLSDSISSNNIDQMYDFCMSLGAEGGKLLGAGGGGFLLIYAKPDIKKKIKNFFSDYNPSDIKINTNGTIAKYI